MSNNVTAVSMPPELKKQWEAAYSQARIQSEQGNDEQAIVSAKAAWEILPEPKMMCSVAHITLRRWVNVQRSAKRYDDGIALANWVINESPRQQADLPIFSVQKGMLLYDAGRLDEARQAFDVAFKDSRDFGFKGEDPKYLKFYLSND